MDETSVGAIPVVAPPASVALEVPMAPAVPAAPAVDQRWFDPIVEFAGHILGGTAVFLLIAGAGWLIHRVTAAIGDDNLVLHYGLVAGEFLVSIADSVLYVLFVASAFWRAARKIVRGFKQ
jgi:hypothetical protein